MIKHAEISMFESDPVWYNQCVSTWICATKELLKSLGSTERENTAEWSESQMGC